MAPALSARLGARGQSLPRPCLGKGTEQSGPGTVARFHCVPDWERGNTTRERKQSSLGSVVIPR